MGGSLLRPPHLRSPSPSRRSCTTSRSRRDVRWATGSRSRNVYEFMHIYHSRCATLSNGLLRYTQIDEAAEMIRMWALGDPDRTMWEHPEVFAEIWADKTYRGQGCPRRSPCSRSCTRGNLT